MRFLELWERRSMSINLNYVAWKKPEVMKIGCVWSFFWLEEFKIILLVLKYLFSHLGSSVKTTIVWPPCMRLWQFKHFPNQDESRAIRSLDCCPILYFIWKTTGTSSFCIFFQNSLQQLSLWNRFCPPMRIRFFSESGYVYIFLTSQLTINNSEIIPPPKWLFVVWIKLPYPALVVRPRSFLLTCSGKRFQKITFSVTVFIG